MKFKKHLVGLMLVTALSSFVAVGASCGGFNPPEPTPQEAVKIDKTGEYYCNISGVEYVLTLNETECSLVMGETALTGVYTLSGEKIEILLSDNSLVEVSVGANTLSFKKGNETYTFYQKIDYTVSFNTDGGSAVANATVVNGKTVAMPTEPTKENHWFLGWYADAEFNTLYDFDARVTANTTVYARFVEKMGKTEFTVNFVVDGQAAFAPMQTKNGVIFNSEIPTPEKEGAVFAGWWVSDYEDGEKLTYKYDETKLGQNTTLYAVWEENDALNVSVTPTSVSWNSVGVNNIYKYVIKDATGKTVYMSSLMPETSEEFDFSEWAAGEYTVEVTVNGTNIKKTAYYKNKALDRVTTFQVSNDRVLTFNAIDNATKYILTVVCGDDNHNHMQVELSSPAYDFSNCAMKEGGITFSVQAVAEGYITGDAAAYSFEARLDAITNLQVNEQTEIVTWDAVENADSYKVEIIDDGVSLGVVNTDETSVSLRGLSGNLEVKVYPVARAYNSSALQTVAFQNTRLAIPMNVALQGHSVVWNEVEGATGYKLTVGSQTYQVNTNSFALSDEHFLNNVSEIYVQAVCADENKTSLKSDLFTVRSDNKMEDSLVYNNGEISWNSVLGAAKYGVVVDGGEEFFVTDANKASVSFARKGDVVIQVRCYNAQNASSEWVSKTVTVYEVAFDVLEGVSVNSMFKAEGDTCTLPETTRVGYNFVGWYDNANITVGAKYDNTFTFGNADMTVFAGWTSKKYTVTLNAGEIGQIVEDTAEVYYNQNFELKVPKCTDPTKIFAGWRSQPEGLGVEYTDLNGVSKIKWLNDDNEIVLYASWYSIFEFKEITLEADENFDVATGWSVTKDSGIAYLETVEIPAVYNGLPVLMVDASAFKNCANLKTIRIPDTIRYVAMGTDGGSSSGSAFEGCSALENVVVYCVNTPEHQDHAAIYESDASGALLRNTSTNKEIVYIPMTATGTFYIPDGVTSIPFGAFYQSKVTKISIPASVTNIAAAAFSKCSYLTALEFQEADDGKEKALTIDMAFDGCVSLRELTLPGRVVNLNFDIFSDLQLTKIHIVGNPAEGSADAPYESRDGVLCQGYAIVYVPKGRTGAYRIPSTINQIADNAFARCSLLTKVSVPANVTLIGKNAFLNCTALEELIFEGDAESPDLTIEDSAFFYNRSLREVRLPANLKYLGKNAFGKTTALTTVYLNVKAGAILENGAFADKNETYYVTDLHLGALVENVDIAAVFGTSKLAHVYVDAANVNYASVDGVLFNKEKTKIVYFPLARGGHYIVPDTVTEISANIFRNKKITSVYIPASVTVIGSFAFCNSAITKVQFEEGGEQALVIEESAFENVKVTSMKIPARATTIGNYAFARLSELNSLTFEDGSNEALTIGEYAFAMYDATTRFSDANTLSSIYKSQLTGVEFPARLKKISAYAFAYAAFTEIVIPEGVTEVENYAFTRNASLTSVSLPASLTTLGARNTDGAQVSMHVFDKCEKLVSVTISGDNEYYQTKDGVLYIEVDNNPTELFFSPIKNTGNNGVVDIPATVSKIWDNAFYENNGITSITFSQGLNGSLDIGVSVFEGCKTLQNIQLPYGVTTIGTNMFKNCVALTSIEIPASVSLLQTNAFVGCSALTEIKFAETPADKEEIALELEDYYQENISNGYYTSKIDFYVFNGCSNISTITLPSRTTKIGERAFWKAKITSVTIPANVTSLGVRAFAECSKLASVTFAGDKLTAIPEYAFEKCYALNTISIPGSIATIGESAFDGCRTLNTVNFSEGLETIESYAFWKLPLTTLSLPASLKTIGPRAFAYNKFATVTFADNSQLETIGDAAFSANEELTTIVIPASVKTIGLEAFDSCIALQSISFAPNSAVETIGNYAFAATALTSFTMPETTADALSLGTGLFADCLKLTQFHISGSVKDMSGVLDDCPNIQAITVADENELYSASEGQPILYSKDKKIIYYVFGALTGDIVLDLSVTKIADSAFKDQEGITSLTIKTNVVEIGAHAFENCTNLATLTFEHVEGTEFALTTIGEKAFYKTAIAEVVLPKNVTSVGKYAFSLISGLTKVEVNAGLTTIGDYAFAQNAKLATVTLPEGLGKIGNYMFYKADALTQVLIPASVKEVGNYAFAANASKKLAKIEFAPDSQVTKIGNYAFNQTAITTMVIPNTVTSFGTYVFDGCKSLASVTLPDGIKTIPDYTFRNCTALTTYTVPETVTKIGKYAFASASVATITLPAGLATIDANAFNANTKLKTVNFAETPTATKLTIGDGAFTGCTLLTAISLPSNLTEIGKLAFSKSKLSSITIPETVTTIKDQAFSECKSLTSATLGNAKLTTIGTKLFEKCTVLANVTLREGLTKLGTYMFGYSSYSSSYSCMKLTKITLPSTLKSIPQYAFANSGLTEIDLSNTAVTEIGEKAFYASSTSAAKLTSLKMNTVCTKIIKNAFEGQAIKGEVDLSKVTYLGSSAFKGNKAITKVTIGKGLVSLGTAIFQNCTGLTSVVFEEGFNVTGKAVDATSGDAGASMFASCSNLGAVTMPSSLKKIAGSMFNGCTKFVPDTLEHVTEISSSAFAKCAAIVTADISNALTVGDAAFSECTKLENVTLNANLASLQGTFYKCSSLKEIALPNSLTVLYDDVFRYTGLTKIDMSNTQISALAYYSSSGDALYSSAYTFADCEDLAEVKFPANLEIIGRAAFNNCVSLKEIKIPDSVTKIGENAFKASGVSGTLALPTGLELLEKNAFLGCLIDSFTIASSNDQFSTLNGCLLDTDGIMIMYSARTIVDGVMTIPEGVMGFPSSSSGSSSIFNGLTGVKEVVLPSTMSKISKYMFYKMTDLEKVTIPATISRIEGYAFEGCSALKDVIFEDGDSELIMGNEDGSNSAYYFRSCSSLTEITLPGRLKVLGKSMFGDSTASYATKNLASVTLSEGIEELGEYAFANTALESITLPESLKVIGTKAFLKTNLTTIDLKNVEVVGESAFEGVQITELTIPASVKTVKGSAFKNMAITAIELPLTVESWGSSVFSSNSKLTDITIPEGYTHLAFGMFQVCTSLEEVQLPSTMERLDNALFYGCTGLTTFNVPEGIVSLGAENIWNNGIMASDAAQVFMNCTNLKTVTLPSTLKVIGKHAFNGCSKLTEITIPESVEFIGTEAFKGTGITSIALENPDVILYEAFKGMTELTTVELPETMTNLGYATFNGCSALEQITLPKGLTDSNATYVPYNNQKTTMTSEGYTFANCTSLKTIVLPNSLTYVPQYMFQSATALESVTLGDSVTSIHTFAFSKCSKLSTINIPATVEEIAKKAFEECKALTTIILPKVGSVLGQAFYNWTSSQTINIMASERYVLKNWDQSTLGWDSSCNAKINYNYVAPVEGEQE